MATNLLDPVTNCWPWWHAVYYPLTQGTQQVVGSGCPVDATGNVPCAPETLRKNAEAQLKRLDPTFKHLSLEAYTLARYMQSEVGNTSIEERVAVGEAAVNRAKREKLSRGVLSLLLYRQKSSSPNYGFYGPIHGTSGVTTAPYGRWAATSQDPTVLTLLLANLVITGQSGDFARGADDQAGMQYSPNCQPNNEKWAFPSTANAVTKYAANGSYWVGPLPGVDQWRTFLIRQTGDKPTSATGSALLQRGIAAVGTACQRPVWDANMPSCPKPPTDVKDNVKAIFLTTLAVGSFVGLGYVAGRVIKRGATKAV